MSLTPADIEAQVFREKFKGYDQDEVDAFLDRVSDRLSELERERDESIKRLHEVEEGASEALEAERLLKRTLITAQRTADATVAEAVEQANLAIAEADQRAAEIVSTAEARAAEIVSDAERSASENLRQARAAIESRQAAADEQLRQVQHAVAELQRFRSEYRDRVRAAVAEQLAMLDSVADIPDPPAEMTRLASASWSPAGRADGGDAQGESVTIPAESPAPQTAPQFEDEPRRASVMNEEQP